MEYLDFELSIAAGSEGNYRLDVRSPAGESKDDVRLPLASPALRAGLAAVEEARGAGGSQRSLMPRKKESVEAGETVRELGRELFAALMSDSVYPLYHSSIQRARDEDKGLRLRLRIEAPALAALPWEYLYDDKLKCGHLCLYKETPLVRHLEVQLPARPLTLVPPIHILGMIGARHGLEVDRERRHIKVAIEHLTNRGTVKLTWLEGHTWRDLLHAMRRGPWHVFHFIGHGGFDPQTGEGLVLLEGDGGTGEEGPTHRLPARDLAELLADHRSLRLVILNCCEGARASETERFSSTGSILATQGIPAVVSMQDKITDRAAIEFSRTFYDVLAEGMPVDAALSEARKAIKMALPATVEWGTPVLHMRSQDGLLFHVDLTGALFPQPLPPRSARQPRLPGAAAEPRAAAADPRQGLLILLGRVRRFWIAGVLEKSLYHAARLELGMEMMEGAVENPWGSVLETPGAGSEPLGPGRTFGQVFDELEGSLLILGEPGSGKTTTLLELARDLLARAEGDPDRAVPVIFNLSSWTGARRRFSEWMVEELADKYHIPKKLGRAWLAECRLLPLLDGLDELSAERRVACVEAVNAFAKEGLQVRVVVCCRLKEYLALPVRLSLNGAVRLRPLSREQVLSYVAQAGPRLAALKALLERDSGMLVDARAPLMLSLMMQGFQDLPVDALESDGQENIAARHKQVMAAYVAHQFRRAKKKARPLADRNATTGPIPAYSEEQATAWLSWLARGMQKHGQTVFLLERLQPSWLQGGGGLFGYMLGSRLIGSLFFGLAYGALLLKEGWNWLIFGVSAAAIAGLGMGLIERFRLPGSRPAVTLRTKVETFALFAVAGYLGVVPVIAGNYYSAGKPLSLGVGSEGFDIGLWWWLFGLFFGVFWYTGSFSRRLTSDVRTAEIRTWSWRHAGRRFFRESTAGFVFLSPILVRLRWWPLDRETNDRSVLVCCAVVFFFVLTSTVFAGLRAVPKIMPTVPNQGIRLSIRSSRWAVLAGAMVASVLILALMAVVYVGDLHIPNDRPEDWLLGFVSLTFTAVAVLVLAHKYGGVLALFQHYLLRFILYCRGSMPWPWVRFLDYAAEELRFLQKVGGGYMFVHRYLREHFAAMGEVAKPEVVDARPAVASGRRRRQLVSWR